MEPSPPGANAAPDPRYRNAKIADMSSDDPVPLGHTDFRRERMLLGAGVFFWPDGEPGAWRDPDDLISKAAWDHIVHLTDHAALMTSAHAGSIMDRLRALGEDWTFSWPELGTAPFMEYPSLLVGEELDALVFNTLHGYYRQALACLRVALEVMAMAAALAVTGDRGAFNDWQTGKIEIKFGRARVLLRDSVEGRAIDGAKTTSTVFGDRDDDWLNSRYKRLCGYAHSRTGYDNGAFWRSSGPLFAGGALPIIESEVRETLALCYLLQRLATPAYAPGQGQKALLAGDSGPWSQYEAIVRTWLTLES